MRHLRMITKVQFYHRTILSLVFTVIPIFSASVFVHHSRSPQKAIFKQKRLRHGTFDLNLTLPFENLGAQQLALRHKKDADYFEKISNFSDLFVKEYTDWHQQQRQLCERNATHARGVPLLIFHGRERNYGIGDRIRGILQSYIMAVASRRLLFINLPRPFPLELMWQNSPNSNFTYDSMLFPVLENEDSLEIVRSKRSVLRSYLRNARVIHQVEMQHLRYEEMRRHISKNPSLAIHRRMAEKGILNYKFSKGEVAALLLQAIFRLSDQLRRDVMNQHPFQAEKFVALHARLGVGVGETRAIRFNASYHGTTLKDTSRCLGRLAGHLARRSDISNVFFSTDTRRANEWISRGVRQELPSGKVAFSSAAAIHLRKLRRVNVTAAHFRGFSQVFVDLGILATGMSMVHLQSGFADIASWAGVMQDTLLVSIEDCADIQNGGEKFGSAFERLVLKNEIDMNLVPN